MAVYLHLLHGNIFWYEYLPVSFSWTFSAGRPPGDLEH